MRDRIGTLDARCIEQDRILEAIATGDNGAEVVQQLQDGQSHAFITSQMPAIAASPPKRYQSLSDTASSMPQDGYASHSAAEGSEGSMTYGTRFSKGKKSVSSVDMDEEPGSPYTPTSDMSHYGRRPTKPRGMSTGQLGSGHTSNEPSRPAFDKIPRSSPHTARSRDYTDPSEPWTIVTSDMALVKHLLSIYFCWEYPAFSSLNKGHFLNDFNSGRRRFCSSLLVNAILSLACKYTDKRQGRANPGDSQTAGDHFFREAERLLDTESDSSLPKIQALQLLSLREASRGEDSQSWSYSAQTMRLATNIGLHLTQSGNRVSKMSVEEWEVRLCTFWGCFALNQLSLTLVCGRRFIRLIPYSRIWALFIGRKPHLLRHQIELPTPEICESDEAEEWAPYTDSGKEDPKGRSPRDDGQVFKCFCELSLIVNDTLSMLHTAGRTPSGQEVWDSYTQYLDWYGSLPDSLRRGKTFAPCALFLL